MGRTATAPDPQDPPLPTSPEPGLTGVLQELDRLRRENRRLATSLGAFSAFVASHGMLQDAWDYVHRIHQMEDGEDTA